MGGALRCAWLTLAAAALEQLARGALHTRPLAEVLPLFLHAPRRFRGRPLQPEAVTRAVTRGARLLPAGSCLPQALAEHRLLRQEGYCPQLRVGIRGAREPALEAHAWVELEGRVILGYLPELGDFTVLPDLALAIQYLRMP